LSTLRGECFIAEEEDEDEDPPCAFSFRAEEREATVVLGAVRAISQSTHSLAEYNILYITSYQNVRDLIDKQILLFTKMRNTREIER
jgi:hypothetical protein